MVNGSLPFICIANTEERIKAILSKRVHNLDAPVVLPLIQVFRVNDRTTHTD